MTRDPYRHVATALHLASAGVTTAELAAAVEIDRKTAQRILVQLVEEGMLRREGSHGRYGYIYYSADQKRGQP